MNAFSIAPDLYYVGVNDRHKALFENMLPLPYGVSYNSYLIVDKKVVLVDAVDACFTEQFLANIKGVLGERPIDFLIVNHMEPDHSSGINTIRQLYPNVQLVGNAKTISMLTGYYGITEGMMEVKDKETLNIGSRTLQFIMAPMVHWPEVMVTYDQNNGILFSADAFGCFGTLDGAVMDTELQLDKYYPEMYRYYANIVGKYGIPVQQLFNKVKGLTINMICSTHGPVWSQYKEKTIDIYDRLSRYQGEPGVVVVYGSMYGHTEQMAEAVARGALKTTQRVILHDVSKSDMSQILSDVFQYSGLIIGSPTYCNALYPNISALIEKIELRGLKNRSFAAFGNYTWAGNSGKLLTAFAERMNWEMKGFVEVKQGVNLETYEKLIDLGHTIAISVNQMDQEV